MWESIPDILFDFEDVLQGTCKLDLFVNPIGVNGKTDADTNMVLQSSLPKNSEFLVKEVEVVFIPKRLHRDVYAEMSASRASFQVRFADKLYFNGFIGRFMRPWKYSHAVEGAVFGETETLPWATGPFIVSVPFYLTGLLHIEASIRWDDSGAPSDGRMGVVFSGLRYQQQV